MVEIKFEDLIRIPMVSNSVVFYNFFDGVFVSAIKNNPKFSSLSSGDKVKINDKVFTIQSIHEETNLDGDTVHELVFVEQEEQRKLNEAIK